MAEILAALKSLATIAELLKIGVEELRSLRDAVTQKNLQDLKYEVNATLIKIKDANSNSKRRELVEELSKKLAK